MEFVNVMYVREGVKILMPKLSEITHSGVRQVFGKGARVGKGLGKRLQGMLRLISVIQKKYRFQARVQARHARKTEIYRRKKREENCQLYWEG